ncbi:hypothetical protein [Chamaesiphon sp. VAR_48_metabat_403]|uniref:hypothetical protein n=1 Tax=Chamaesiphon sp. VAR_48_metabat_403 TaxID=2964700 RepID=UPI00286DBEE6|nr:hypothetical protein [Chamaesiphon sp. VAR_48_metabat_403]
MKYDRIPKFTITYITTLISLPLLLTWNVNSIHASSTDRAIEQVENYNKINSSGETKIATFRPRNRNRSTENYGGVVESQDRCLPKCADPQTISPNTQFGQALEKNAFIRENKIFPTPKNISREGLKTKSRRECRSTLD